MMGAAREWPLVAFTLLAQSAVGFFLAFALPLALAEGPAAGRPAILRSLAIVLALLAVSAAISFFHLGKPSNAWRTLGNLQESWLSREIGFLLSTMGSVAALFIVVWARVGGRGLAAGVAVAAALAGIGLILSMANIYRLKAVPSWNSGLTIFSFFMTAVLLGALGACAALALGIAGPGAVSRLLEGALVRPSMFAALLDLAGALFLDGNFGILRAGSGRRAPSTGHRSIFIFRIALLAAAVLVLYAVLLKAGDITGTSARASLVAALGAGLASEGLGRYQFYALFRKAGL